MLFTYSMPHEKHNPRPYIVSWTQAAVLAALLTPLSAAEAARSVKLAWKPSPDADVAGYRVHYGNARGNHGKTVDAAKATTVSIPNLADDSTYYFVVTAYNHAGLESEPSKEMSVGTNATSPTATASTPTTTTAPATSNSGSATSTAPTATASTPATTTTSKTADSATGSKTAPSATNGAAYTAWSAAQIPSEQDRSLTADADGDGLSNLLEYALGSSPVAAESTSPLSLTRDGNKIVVRYSRPADRTDVRYELQVSHNLTSWVAVPDTQRSAASNSADRVYSRNVSGIERLFFRLNVSGAGSTASTNPVGVLNIKVPGANGNSSTAGTSVIGVGLTPFAVYRGTAETIDKNTLGDTQAQWTDGQFDGSNGGYVLEITSGPGAGTTYDIEKTSAQTVTLSQPLASGVASGVTFEIRKQWTLGSIFGMKNEAGLAGGSEATADLVQIRNGEQYDTYYYQTTGAGGVGWRKQGDTSTDQSSAVVYQEDGITIKRKQAQPVQLSFVGAVKQGKTSIPVFPGQNVLANVYSAPMTLASSGLYTGNPTTGLASGTEATADQVLVWDGSKYDTYYYSTQGGWRKVGAANDAAKAQIPVGGAITIVRKASNGFNWVVPQHPVKQ